MATDIGKVKEYLRQYGWGFNDFTAESILSGFTGSSSEFTILVSATDEWTVLSISPLVPCSLENSRLNLLNYLAQLNFHATLAKFSLDDEDNVVLTVELPSSGLNYDSFVVALESLCAYADDQHKVLLTLVADPYATGPSLKKI